MRNSRQFQAAARGRRWRRARPFDRVQLGGCSRIERTGEGKTVGGEEDPLSRRCSSCHVLDHRANLGLLCE